MTTDLREELSALAETQSFSPDPSAWDRGRRVRRRDRVVRSAAVLAVVAVVAGAGAIAVRPDRQAPQPADVPGGAIPSRIDYVAGAFEDDYAIGRASVGLGGNGLVLIGAEDGRSHRFAIDARVFALSPDGYRVAWWSGGDATPEGDRILIADLRTGEITAFAHNMGRGAEVASMTWAPDSVQLRWNGRDDEGARDAAWIDVTGPSESNDIQGRYGARGVPSPSTDMVALDSDGAVTAAPFEQQPARGSGRLTGIPVDRELPPDLYPDGASVTPVGWADDSLLVAQVDAPAGSYVEGEHLVLLTSPDRRESEWTYRILVRDVPTSDVSLAVDLIPDLDGTSSQKLTHDFSASAADSDGRGPLPYALGGLLALLSGLAFIRMMHQRA